MINKHSHQDPKMSQKVVTVEWYKNMVSFLGIIALG